MCNHDKLLFQVIKGYIIFLMREEDEVFDKLFKEVHHTGSFYDGLRVGNAKEFDLNLVFDMENNLNQYMSFKAVYNGFVKVELSKSLKEIHIPPSNKFHSVRWAMFDTIFYQPYFSSPYLDTDKVKRWIQRIWSKIEWKVRDQCLHEYKDIQQVRR